MTKIISKCPSCGGDLHISSLACPDCGIELRGQFDRDPGLFDGLTKEQRDFMLLFLRCRGNMSQLQTEMGISYPTAKKKLDDLLTCLGLVEKKEEEIDLSNFGYIEKNSVKASEIIKRKLYENGGRAEMPGFEGNLYSIAASSDGVTFTCSKTRSNIFEYKIFDVIVDLLMSSKGYRAPKGQGRGKTVGEDKCTADTVVGAVQMNYYGKKCGEQATLEPVFILAAVLEWAGIAHNERGWLSLTAEYLAKREET